MKNLDAKVQKLFNKKNTNKIVFILVNGEIYKERQSAAYALGELQDDIAIEPLIKSLDDKVKIVAEESLKAVYKFKLEDSHLKLIEEKTSEWIKQEEKKIEKENLNKYDPKILKRNIKSKNFDQLLDLNKQYKTEKRHDLLEIIQEEIVIREAQIEKTNKNLHDREKLQKNRPKSCFSCTTDNTTLTFVELNIGLKTGTSNHSSATQYVEKTHYQVNSEKETFGICQNCIKKKRYDRLIISIIFIPILIFSGIYSIANIDDFVVIGILLLLGAGALLIKGVAPTETDLAISVVKKTAKTQGLKAFDSDEYRELKSE